MAFCEQCGHPNPDGSSFCTGCGRPLTPSGPTTTTTTPITSKKPTRNRWLIPVLVAAVVIVMAAIAVVAVTRGSNNVASAGTATASTAITSTTTSLPPDDSSDASTPSRIRLVTPLRADEIIVARPEGLAVIDVRTPSEYAEGSLPGAINIDRFDPVFAARLDQLDKDDPYVVYCRTGNRSAEATDIMADLGFTNVSEIEGGIVAWSAAGLPVTQGSVAAAESETTTTVSPYPFSYVANRYPRTSGQDAAFSGCRPGTPNDLPDGVWYGFSPTWTSSEIVFDLACVTWVYDSTCSCERPQITNDNDLLRTLRFSTDALAYGLSDGDPIGPMTVTELTTNPGSDIGAHRYAEGVELVISVNSGLVTEIAIPNHS